MSVLALCKFTPLGFETLLKFSISASILFGVNLPRWGLKPEQGGISLQHEVGCKFTPLGFETLKQHFKPLS